MIELADIEAARARIAASVIRTPLVRRAGTIEITADADGTVWVGGAATAYIRGTITL